MFTPRIKLHIWSQAKGRAEIRCPTPLAPLLFADHAEELDARRRSLTSCERDGFLIGWVPPPATSRKSASRHHPRTEAFARLMRRQNHAAFHLAIAQLHLAVGQVPIEGITARAVHHRRCPGFTFKRGCRSPIPVALEGQGGADLIFSRTPESTTNCTSDCSARPSLEIDGRGRQRARRDAVR